jgi:sulfate/thiosulfate transport system permease protein
MSTKVHGEGAIGRRLAIGVAVVFLMAVVVLPLGIVLVQALRDGPAAYVRALVDPHTRSAIWLTLATVGVAVPLNVVFGVAVAWAVTKHDMPGRRTLLTLVDVPFAVSPVVAGMAFVLVLGRHTAVGGWLAEHGLQVIFAFPGIALATTFVTLPIVARELVPLMEAQGRDRELAAVALGASGWQTLKWVTLPAIRPALVYGMVLCTARAAGEFGAVSVVSGHIRGRTNTLPLHVEALYNEYQFSAAFAVATLLVGVAALTIVAKRFAEGPPGHEEHES